MDGAATDGSHVRALKGGYHNGPSPVDRGRPGSKRHLITDRRGIPLAIALTGGNRHDVTQLLLDLIPPIRGLRGRLRRRPRRLFADRGYDYDYDKYRRTLRCRGITPRIARRGIAHGSGLGKTRWVVERTFARLHQFKRLRIRYEVRAGLHPGLLQLVSGVIRLRRLRTSLRNDQSGEDDGAYEQAVGGAPAGRQDVVALAFAVGVEEDGGGRVRVVLRGS